MCIPFCPCWVMQCVCKIGLFFPSQVSRSLRASWTECERQRGSWKRRRRRRRKDDVCNCYVMCGRVVESNSNKQDKTKQNKQRQQLNRLCGWGVQLNSCFWPLGVHNVGTKWGVDHGAVVDLWQLACQPQNTHRHTLNSELG